MSTPHKRTRTLVLAFSLAALAAAVAAPAAFGFVGFDSPSGNIGCAMGTGGVRCDIDHHSWPTPAKPSSCDLDYGQGVGVDKHGKASFVCAGDTTLHVGKPLPYGQSKTTGRFRCTSLESGVRCINRSSGHGFLLSIQKVRLF